MFYVIINVCLHYFVVLCYFWKLKCRNKTKLKLKLKLIYVNNLYDVWDWLQANSWFSWAYQNCDKYLFEGQGCWSILGPLVGGQVITCTPLSSTRPCHIRFNDGFMDGANLHNGLSSVTGSMTSSLVEDGNWRLYQA